MLEANRTQALEQGWLICSFDQLNEPLVARDGHRTYLDDVGGRIDGTALVQTAGGTP